MLSFSQKTCFQVEVESDEFMRKRKKIARTKSTLIFEVKDEIKIEKISFAQT